jgi:hypothetical protein
MRPDMLNIIGCPRNVSLQQILLEAQRVEEILYYRTQQGNQANNSTNNTTYNNNNYVNRNNSTNNSSCLIIESDASCSGTIWSLSL